MCLREPQMRLLRSALVECHPHVTDLGESFEGEFLNNYAATGELPRPA
jgi:hypothetical protein